MDDSRKLCLQAAAHESTDDGWLAAERGAPRDVRPRSDCRQLDDSFVVAHRDATHDAVAHLPHRLEEGRLLSEHAPTDAQAADCSNSSRCGVAEALDLRCFPRTPRRPARRVL